MSTARYLPHYTVDDYRQWPGEWELWNGVPVSMTPSPFGNHQYVATNLAAELRAAIRAAGGLFFVLVETDWNVDTSTVVRPDVAVVADRVPPRHIERPPVLIAEVLSPATAEKDRTAKYQLYEQQRVDFYLIIDPEARTVAAHRLTERGTYERIASQAPLVLPLADRCSISLEPDHLF